MLWKVLEFPKMILHWWGPLLDNPTVLGRLENIEENLLTRNKVTLVVNSCDANKDVLQFFFSALDEYWAKRDFNTVVNTETEYNKLNKTILSKLDTNDVWGLRFLRILEEVKTEYVIVVYDDYILESLLDTSLVNNIIGFMDSRINCSVFYLNAVCINDHEDDPYSEYRLLKDKVEYRLNSAPAIWRKRDLVHYVFEKDNPWSLEVFGSYRTFGNGKDFYSRSSVKNNIFDYAYKKGGAVYRGKWVSDVVIPKNNKYKLDIDLNVRGMSDSLTFEKRSFKWKIKFLYLGYNMVGYKLLWFLFFSIKRKLNNYFG
jgi:hypothetical protein